MKQSVLDKASEVLSDDEIQKANRFYFEKDRKASIASRAALRILLSKFLNEKPGNLRFDYTEYGKPHLSTSNDLQFNVSHAGQYGLIVIYTKAVIGVDIEQIKYSSDLVDVAKRNFSTAEVRKFLSLNEVHRPEGFFNCWTRKESFIKAVGEGLSFPLDQFEVTLLPDEETELINTFFDPTEKDKWSLFNLDVPKGYKAAFCVRDKITDFSFAEFHFD